MKLEVKITSIWVYFFILPICVFVAGIKNPLTWPDKLVYETYFNMAKVNTYSQILKNIQDPFFTILNKFFISFGFDFELFLFIVAGITLILKFSAFNKATKNVFSLFLLYFSFYFFLHDYIQIRIAFALSLLLFAIFCIKNKFVRFLILIISVFFHLSLFPFVFLYFVYALKDKIGEKFFFLSFLIFSFLFSFVVKVGSVGGERSNQYVDSDLYNYFNFFALLPLIQSFAIVYHFFLVRSKKFNFEYYMSILGLFLYYFLYSMPAVATRFYEISAVFFIIFISNFYKKNSVYFCIYVLFFIVCLYNLFIKDGSIMHPVAYDFFISIF